jgi:DNA polymerase-3 subunit alpha
LSQLSEHHQGLIVLSGCLRGEIPGWLLGEETQRAKKRAADYLDLFGRSCFFIEMQPPLTETHRLLNEKLLKLSGDLDLQVVATANCHTLNSDETELVRILAAIRLGTSVDQVVPMGDNSFRSPEEMKAEFAHLPEAIEATVSIAERCNLDLDLGKIQLPRFPLGEGQKPNGLLMQLAKGGLEARFTARGSEETPEYRQRLDDELQTIERLGLAGYFLIVADFVRYAMRKGVPVGPGSGSAGSSLVAHALGITEIDPLRYDLLYENLMNPLRPEVPDMDLGFGMEMREEIHRYLQRKYGEDQVTHIASLGTMQWRTALRDVKKVLDFPQEDVEKAGFGPEDEDPHKHHGAGAALAWKEESSASPPQKMLELAAALEGLPRQVSTHATGVVIGDGPLVQRTPLFRGVKNDWVSQYDMHALKRVGLVKFDLIARKTLTVIRKTLAGLDEHSRPQMTLLELPHDDDLAFSLLCRGEVAGIPYLEGMMARDLLHKWQPRGWNDLLLLMALVQRATLESGLTERLLQARQQTEEVPAGSSELTTGKEFLLFDTDLTRSIASTTGWPSDKADRLCRSLMDNEESLVETLRLDFFEEAKSRGHKRSAVEKTWDRLEHSAGLASSKSKTVARALTVLQATFLKARFPKHYMAALLSSELRQHDLLVAHLEACRGEDIEFLPPEINTSEVEFTVEKGGIRIGLAAIRHVSQATAAAVVQVRRERGPFRSLHELCANVERNSLGKRALTALIKAGALDNINRDRQRLLGVLPDVMGRARQGQMALFNGSTEEASAVETDLISSKLELSTRFAQEKEALGFYLRGHPLSDYRSVLTELAPGGTESVRRVSAGSLSRLGGVVTQVRKISGRKNEPLWFLQLEDFDGSLEVVVFEDVYVQCEGYIDKEAQILVSGRVTREAGQVRLVAEQILPLETAAVQLATSIHLHITVEGFSAQELRELLKMIDSQPGSCQVYLHLRIGRQTEVILKLPSSRAVQPTRKLRAELTQRFGEHCLEVQYRELPGA